MGQLEKYGLYVLCLVIFMILGVALWGDPAAGASPRGGRRESAPISAPGSASGSASGSAGAQKGPQAIAGVDLDSLLGIGGKDSGGKDKGAQQPPNGGNGSKPVAAPPPAPDTKRPTYVIKDRDSFESIARTQLKDVGLRDLVMQLNPDVLPTRMRPGKEIVLPSPAEIAARKPVAVAKEASADKSEAKPAEAKPVPAIGGERMYTVQKGDTFERIAGVELGSKKRTAELMALNPGIKPEMLRQGRPIKLPKK